MLEEIKKLRLKTGAGILDCKTALKESQNDMDKALQWLKKKGLAKAQKSSFRKTGQGRVATYIHGEGRIGVLVEVNVETDFAAKSSEFKSFTHQLCLHIAGINPLFISRKQVPEELIQKEKAVFQAQVEKEGKNPNIQEKIIEGRLNKWFTEICLMEQTFLTSSPEQEPQTVETALKEMIARLGENMLIRRFARFELGEEI